jgi:single stranded DNA-binding protein
MKNKPDSRYELWAHLHNEHGLTLLESEIDEIIYLTEKLKTKTMVNKIILIGNIGQGPEFRTLDNGRELCKFSLATSENYKDKSGEWQDRTTWHNIAVWGNQASRAAKLNKGDTLYLEGKQDNRKYEKDGQTRYISEVVCNYFRKLNKSEAKQFSQPEVKKVLEGNDDLPF